VHLLVNGAWADDDDDDDDDSFLSYLSFVDR